MPASATRPARRLARGLALAAVLGAWTLPLTGGAERVSEAAPTTLRREIATELAVGTAGPFGSVSIIGDSVLQGAGLYGPTLPDRLHERGWGPIRFRAGVAYSTGFFGRSPELTAAHWLDRWRSEGWVADNVIVNLGTNDTEFCGPDVECSRQAIRWLVERIGPDARVWWPKITKTSTHTGHAAAWNQALDDVAATDDRFVTWDWPSEFATGPYVSADNTHLAPDSYRYRSVRIAEEFTERMARARRVGPPVDVRVERGPASTYRPLSATRVLDTRDAGTGLPLSAGDTVRLELNDLVGDLPDSTGAVALYVAAAAPSGPGWFGVAPCAAASVAATLTFDDGAVGTATIVAIDDDGAVCLTAGGPPGTTAHAVVDVQGALVAGLDELRLRPIATPERLVDTRLSDEPLRPGRRLRIDAPPGARALVLNLAATGAREAGFLVAHDCAAVASGIATANLNVRPGPARSAMAVVPVVDGAVCVSTSVRVHVIADLTAEFVPPRGGGAAFVPIEPLRVLDTRAGTGGWSPVHGEHQTLDIVAGPGWADAVTGTLTMVRPSGAGFLQVVGCGAEPAIASVNGSPAVNTTNGVVAALGTGGLACITSSRRTHTVVDVTGWWVDASLFGRLPGR